MKRPTVKLDADEKELLESVSSAENGSPPAAANVSALGAHDMPRRRSARTDG